MNRLPVSFLRLFDPDATHEPAESAELLPFEPVQRSSASLAMDADEETSVIPFASARRALVLSGRHTPALGRARMIHANSQCSRCSGQDVEPLELDDAVASFRNGQPVPGTATIIGFHCNDCGYEWPVYEISRHVQR
jgi:hypothetical protein